MIQPPWHSDIVQSSASVDFPGHCTSPPAGGSLQARALTLDPRPQEAVHWDQCPHSCQLAAVAAMSSDDKTE